MPTTVTFCSCIASSIAACVFGGARLISSASTMLAKTGPWTNWNSRRPSAPSWRMSVPVMSIGIRSGVNWMRLNLQRHRLGQLADHQRLGQPGHAHQQGVPAGEQADRQPLDDVVLADDHPAQLLAQPGINFAEPVDGLHIIVAEVRDSRGIRELCHEGVVPVRACSGGFKSGFQNARARMSGPAWPFGDQRRSANRAPAF